MFCLNRIGWGGDQKLGFRNIGAGAGESNPGAPLLVRAQRFRRIDHRRAARGNPAGEQREQREERGRCADREWIHRRDLEEERPHESSDDREQRDTGDDPRRRSSTSPCRATITATDPGCAPSAMRTPSSRVRSVTMYAITPYSPTTPRASVTAAATPSMIIVNERRASDSLTVVSIDLASKVGSAGSSSWTSCWRDRVVAATSPVVRATSAIFHPGPYSVSGETDSGM